MNSAPRFTSVLVLGSAPFALLDSYGHEPDLIGSVVVGSCFVLGGFWVLVWFRCSCLSGSFLTLPIRIRLGDLCLSAHIAPLPVQKKNMGLGQQPRRRRRLPPRHLSSQRRRLVQSPPQSLRMRHGCTKKSAAVTHPKPVDEGAEDREEEAATDDSVVEQQAARNTLRYLQYLRLLCGRQDPLAYHSATITFNEWMENGSSLDFFTDNETSPGGTNDTDNEEEEAEEEANDETEEQRIGVRGPIEESEDPDAWIEWHYDPMDVDEEEEYFRETGAETDDEADGTEEHEEQDDKENVDPEE